MGKSRLIQELFFQILYKHPEWRNKISFDKNDIHKNLLILENEKAPNNFLSINIDLCSFNENEVNTWLKMLFLCKVPEEFSQRLWSLTEGNARQIWSVINFLDDKKVLRDPTGKITNSTLKLVPWDTVFHDDNVLSENFDYLYEELSTLLKQRTKHISESLWKKISDITLKTADKNLRRQRRARLNLLKGIASLEKSDFELALIQLHDSTTTLKDEDLFLVDYYRARNYIAFAHLRQGKIDLAVTEYEETLSKIKSLPLADRDKITNLELGSAYLSQGSLDKALKRIEEEKEFFQKRGDKFHLIHCLYNLAIAKSQLGHEDTKQSYEEVIKMALDIHDTAYLFRGFNGLGNTLKNSHQWQKALDAYNQSLEVALAMSDFTAASAAAQNRGSIKDEHGFTKEAIADFELSLSLSEKIPQKYTYENTLICRVLEQLGSIYSKVEDYIKASDYLDRAWHLCQQHQDLESFRFWVLLARCRHFIKVGNEDKLNEDLVQLNFYAQSDKQKDFVEKIKSKATTTKTSNIVKISRLETELNRILQINQELVAEARLSDLLKKILSYAIELSNAELGVLLLSHKGKLSPSISLNADLDEDLCDISLSVANKVLSTGQVIKTADAGQDLEFNQYTSVMALNLKSILGVPIVFKGVTLGVLYLSHRYRVGVFDEKVITVMQTFADQAGLAIKNHQLLDFYKKANVRLQEDLDESEKELSVAREKLKSLPDYLRERFAKSQIITVSDKMISLLEKAEKIARSSIAIVIHGESGAGKEVVARFIHESSPRKKEPFIAINCGALPSNLVESELFGHKKGSFTGADRDKVGLIKAADGGTLFLDEITDLPLEMQVKLLRVLQEKEITRLGETQPQSVDIRIVAASHKTLKEAVSKKEFREDLYYRLAGIEFHLPSLKERPEDIPALAEHFLDISLKDNKKENPQKIHSSLLRMMMNYPWPGNVRELKNFIEVGVTLTETKTLKEQNYPDYLIDKFEDTLSIKNDDGEEVAHAAGWYDPRKSWKEHELLIYSSALVKYDFDAQKTATNLDVGIATVYKWLRENRLKETRDKWEKSVLPYEDNLKLKDLQAHIFKLAAKRHTGHPYKAAKELDVAPVTFYRWTKEANEVK